VKIQELQRQSRSDIVPTSTRRYPRANLASKPTSYAVGNVGWLIDSGRCEGFYFFLVRSRRGMSR